MSGAAAAIGSAPGNPLPKDRFAPAGAAVVFCCTGAAPAAAPARLTILTAAGCSIAAGVALTSLPPFVINSRFDFAAAAGAKDAG